MRRYCNFLFVILLLIINTMPITAQEGSPPAVEEGVTPSQSSDVPPWGVEEDQGSRFMQQLMHMLLSLGFIVLLIVVVAWGLKRILSQRLTQANSSSAIQVLERRTLSAKAAVYLLEVKGHTIVVGESPAGLTGPGTIRGEDLPAAVKNFAEVYEKSRDQEAPTDG